MNFPKSAVALAVMLACSSASALQEIPLDPSPPTVGTSASGVQAQAQVTPLADVELGHASAGFALDPILRKAFVTNFGSGTLSVIDVDTYETTTVPVGPNPRRLVYSAALHRVYIVNDVTPGIVTVFDAEAGAVMATIPVGSRPRNIASNFRDGEVYVSNFNSNTMSVIATATNEVVATVSVGSQPFMGEVDPTHGFVYVVSQLDRVVDVIDTATKQVVARVNTGNQPNGATVDPRSGKVYVNNTLDQSITVIDPLNNVVKTVTGIGAGSTFGTISTVYRRYYLPNALDHTVTILDTDTDEIVRHVPVGASPQQVTSDTGGGDLYIVNRISNTVSIMDLRTEKVTQTVDVGVNPWRVYLGLGKAFALNENGAAHDTISVFSLARTLAGTALADGWYHAGFDHYFHSPHSSENRLLSDGLFGSAWDRTYDIFRVWTADAPGRVGVCRFLNASFGEKSSHVYVAAGAECEALKAGNVWQFEEVSYYVEPPDAQGNCRSGTVPLYRSYNNGMGGAPNHHVTGDRAKRDALVGSGWIAEGSGPDVIAACGPSLRGDEL